MYICVSTHTCLNTYVTLYVPIYLYIQVCVSDQMFLLAEFSPSCLDTETEPRGCSDRTPWAVLLRMGRTALLFTKQTSAIQVTHNLILLK